MVKNANIYKAILEVRKEACDPIKASNINPMYTKKYATLQSIMDYLNPILAKNNLIYTSRFVRQDEIWGVESELVWTDGDTVETVSSFFPGDRIADAQQMGKLYTYARRYNLTGLLNLTFIEDEDDDDGNGLKGVQKTSPKPLITNL